MRYIFTLFCLFFFTSCVNTTLHNQNRAFKSFFVSQKEDCPANSLCLVEIDATQIRSQLKSEKDIIWVHLWRYWCKGSNCKSLSYYDDLAKKYPNIKFFLVSESYDYQKIKKVVQNQTFSQNIYVIKYEKYSSFMTKNRKMFVKELLENSFKDSVLFQNDYLFCKDKLLYGGAEISEKIIDELTKIEVSK
jgi:hypothetical protein